MAKDTVDTRVVRMEFDNKQFEKNIKQTSKSLDNFKRDLDFKGVGDSLEKVKVKFSAMQIAATTFVVNLTNRLMQLGSTLVKSLSVDNISSGWAKFGEKTISVATMMAQKIRIAGEEITDLAKKTEVVNEQLDKLTWFSDETSYSFTDMTNYVGKFIAAGQDLDKSVKAMEGIATWAALSGQNAQVASRAMMQLAQAMGRSINRQDWSSIQTANMDTEEFRENVLATAVALGELTKEGEQFVTKTGKKFDKSGFLQYFSEGWFTSDVLVETLNKYSAAVDEIYEISIREGLTATEVLEKYGDQFDEFAIKAFRAAQEARTFTDVINAVKDAVSSKWMTTFETIFGNKDESIKLWSELANELYDVFAESGNFRNDILSVWKEFGGRDDIFGEHGEPNQGAFWNLYDAIIAVRDLIKKAWNTVFPLSQMESASDQVDDIARRLKDLTQRIKDFTYNLKMSEELGSRLSKVFQVIFSLLKGSLIVLKTIRFIIDPIIELGKQIVGQVLDQIIYSTNRLLKVGSGFEAFAVRLQSIIANLVDSLNVPAILDEVFSFIKDTFKILENLHPIESLIGFIEDFTKAFEDAGGTSENFKKIINAVLSVIGLVRKAIVSIVLTLTKYVTPVLDDIIDILVKIAGFILGTAVKIVSIIADLITNINNAFQGKGNADEFKNQIFGILEQLGNLARSIVPIIGSLIKIILKLVEVVLLLPKMLNELSKRLTGKGIIENLNSIFDGIINTISNFVNGIKNAQSKPGSFSGLFNALISVIEGLWEVIKGLLAVAQLVLTVLGSALKKIGLAIQYIADILIKVFSGRANELTSGEKQMLGVIAALAALAVIGVTLYNLIWLITSIFKPISVLIDSLTGVLDSISYRIKVSIIETFSNSILKMAISLSILASLDTTRLWNSVGAIAAISVIFLALIVLISTLNKQTVRAEKEFKTFKEGFLSLFGRESKNNGIGMLIYAMKTMASSMLKLSLATLIFNKIGWEGIWQTLTVFSITITFLTGLFAALYAITKNGQYAKDFQKLISSFSAVLVSASLSLLMLSTISWEGIGRALTGFSAIIVLLTGLLAALYAITKNGQYVNGFQKLIGSLSAVLLSASLSLLMLSAISWEGIGRALTEFSAIIALLTGLLAALYAITKNGQYANDFQKIIGSLSAVLLSASLSLLMLSTISWEGIGRALTEFSAIIALLTGLLAALYAITKNGQYAKDFQKIIASLSAVLLSASLSLLMLSTISWEGIGRALTGFSAIMVLLTGLLAALYAITKNGQYAKDFQKIIASLSAVLLSASLSLLMLSTISWEGIGRALTGFSAIMVLLTGLLAALYAITKNGTYSENILKIFKNIIISIAALAAILGLLSLSNPANVLAAAGALSIVLATLAGSLYILMNKRDLIAKGGVEKTLKMLTGIIIAMSVLATALGLLSLSNPANVLAAAGALSILLATLTGSLYVLVGQKDISGSIIKIAIAFGILSMSMIPLAYVLRMFSDIPLIDMGKGLLGIVGGILVFTVAAKLLGAIVPIMAAAAGVLLLIGLSALTAGIGIRAIVDALTTLNKDFTPALEILTTHITGVISSVIEGLLNILPKIVEVITVIVGVILDSLTELVPKIVTLISTILDGVLALLNTYGVPFIETTVTLVSSILDGVKYLLKTHGNDIIEIAVSLLDKLLKTVSEHMNSISQSLMDIVKSILSALKNNIGDIVNLLAGIIVGLLDGLRKNIGPITKALIDFLIEATIALFENIGPLIDIVTDYVFDFIARVTVALTGKLIALAGLITKVVLIILAAVIRLTIASLGALSKLFITFVSAILLILVHTFIGLTSVLLEIFKVIIKESLRVLVEAIIWAQDAFVAIGKMILSLILRGIINTMLLIGGWILDIIDAIFGTDLKGKLQGVADNLANEARNMVNSISAGTDKVENAIRNASNNINGVVSMTAEMASEAVGSSVGAISDTVTDSMDQLSGAMQQFGEEAGSNLYTGMGSSDNINGAKQVGQDMGNATAKGFAEATETHSPSRLFARFGNFLMEGLGLGIQNGASETENIMAEVISESLNLATDILNGQDGDDYTIKVGMDISSVEAQTSKIQDMMSGVNNPNITASGKNAGYNAKALERNNSKGSDTVNNDLSTTVTYNNVFNIESTDPQQSADEIDKVLKEQNTRFKLAHGT